MSRRSVNSDKRESVAAEAQRHREDWFGWISGRPLTEEGRKEELLLGSQRIMILYLPATVAFSLNVIVLWCSKSLAFKRATRIVVVSLIAAVATSIGASIALLFAVNRWGS